jgi:hypothetical protein
LGKLARCEQHNQTNVPQALGFPTLHTSCILSQMQPLIALLDKSAVSFLCLLNLFLNPCAHLQEHPHPLDTAKAYILGVFGLGKAQIDCSTLLCLFLNHQSTSHCNKNQTKQHSVPITTATPNKAIRKKIRAVCMAWPHLVESNQSAAKWPAHQLAWDI